MRSTCAVCYVQSILTHQNSWQKQVFQKGKGKGRGKGRAAYDVENTFLVILTILTESFDPQTRMCDSLIRLLSPKMK